MAPRRETIQQAIKTRLLDIAVADGFNHDITSVSLQYTPPQALNRSDFPRLMILAGGDRDDRETQGAQTSNRYHRLWEFKIVGISWPEGDVDEVRIAGELLNEDIEKQLTLDKEFGISSLGFGLTFTLDNVAPPDPFEVGQTRMVWLEIDITVHYSFKPVGF